MAACGEPPVQPILGLAELGVRDPDFLEAELAAPPGDVARQLPEVAGRRFRRRV